MAAATSSTPPSSTAGNAPASAAPGIGTRASWSGTTSRSPLDARPRRTPAAHCAAGANWYVRSSTSVIVPASASTETCTCPAASSPSGGTATGSVPSGPPAAPIRTVPTCSTADTSTATASSRSTTVRSRPAATPPRRACVRSPPAPRPRRRRPAPRLRRSPSPPRPRPPRSGPARRGVRPTPGGGRAGPRPRRGRPATADTGQGPPASDHGGWWGRTTSVRMPSTGRPASLRSNRASTSARPTAMPVSPFAAAASSASVRGPTATAAFRAARARSSALVASAPTARRSRFCPYAFGPSAGTDHDRPGRRLPASPRVWTSPVWSMSAPSWSAAVDPVAEQQVIVEDDVVGVVGARPGRSRCRPARLVPRRGSPGGSTRSVRVERDHLVGLAGAVPSTADASRRRCTTGSTLTAAVRICGATGKNPRSNRSRSSASPVAAPAGGTARMTTPVRASPAVPSCTTSNSTHRAAPTR